MKLSGFEDAALRYILTKEAPSLLCHMDNLSVSSREYTGVGVYINIEYIEIPASRFEVGKATLGSGVFAVIGESNTDVGFLLYIDDGLISMLEIFCHGNEDFPSNIEKYEFGNLQ